MSPPTQTSSDSFIPKESPSASRASLLFPSSSEQSDLDVYSSSSAVVHGTHGNGHGHVSGNGSGGGHVHAQAQFQGQSQTHPALHSAYPDVHMASIDQASGQGQSQRPQAHHRPKHPVPSTSHAIPRRDPFFGEGMGMGMDDDEYTDSDYDSDGDESSSASRSDDGGPFEDSSDSNSDDNLDKALVAPNKTLFVRLTLSTYNYTCLLPFAERIRRFPTLRPDVCLSASQAHISANGTQRASKTLFVVSRSASLIGRQPFFFLPFSQQQQQG